MFRPELLQELPGRKSTSTPPDVRLLLGDSPEGQFRERPKTHARMAKENSRSASEPNSFVNAYCRFLLKKSMVRSQASVAAALSYRGVVSLWNP